MPRRFSTSAAAVIADALERARAEGTSEIAEEHLFAALLDHPESRPLFGRVGRPDGAGAVWAEVREARRRAGITASERASLSALGVDVDEIIARVEARLGEGALDATQAGGGRGRRGWRVTMTPGAIAALRAAHKRKEARRDREFTAAHLVLGLLARPGLFADPLEARGITEASVLAALPDPGTGQPGAGPSQAEQ